MKTGKTEQAKRQYSAPELKDFGTVADLVEANEGTGTDGGAFSDDTAS